MNDEIKQQAEKLGITPAELGLDAERLPGQVPELDAKAQSETPVDVPDGRKIVANSFPIPEGTPDLLAKAFRTIKHDAVKTYREIWEGFANKDMSFIEFACEMACATNPLLMQRDLAEISQRRRMGGLLKAGIDGRLSLN